jgi:hypothetical protein
MEGAAALDELEDPHRQDMAHPSFVPKLWVGIAALQGQFCLMVGVDEEGPNQRYRGAGGVDVPAQLVVNLDRTVVPRLLLAHDDRHAADRQLHVGLPDGPLLLGRTFVHVRRLGRSYGRFEG